MSNEKNDAGLIWILAIFFSWLSSLIFYLNKKDDPFLYSQAKLALNLSLNIMIVWVVVGVVVGIIFSVLPSLAIIGTLLYIVIFAGWVFICVKQMQKAKETTGEAQLALPIPMITLIK
ncbi:MAG: DUF4870 domain-containing protein [Saezia sp.]